MNTRKNYLYILFIISLLSPLNPYIRTLFNNDNPQLIFVLGGDSKREISGIKISKELHIPIVISSGSNPAYSKWLVKKEGLSPKLIRRDYRAKDTLTNFTSLIDEFAKDGINHALLITSKDHVKRSMLIGNIIAGSRGIKITSLPIPCKDSCKKESQKKQYIDLFRAIVWVITRRDIKEIFPDSLIKDFIN